MALLLALLAVSVSRAAEVPDRFADGVELFEAAEYADAKAFFSAVSRQADGAWLDYYLGRLHLQEGEVDSAIERLEASVDADRGSSLFALWLGEAYVQKIDEVGMLKKLGVAKKARTSFERAVEIAPDDYEAREALVGYYLNAPSVAGGSRDKAMEQAVAMTKLDPVNGHRLMGRIHVEEEDWEKAAEEYRAAIDAGDESTATYYWLGFAAQQSQDWEVAFEAFERAIQLDERNLGPYYQIGRTAIFSESRLDRAVECLTSYLEQPQQRGSPAPEHAHWRLGMVYELQHRDELAAAEYRKALELDPKHEEARKALKGLGST